MINSGVLAATLMQNVVETFGDDPEKFWAKVGLNYDLVRSVADAGSEVGAGDPEQIMASMIMGAVLTMSAMNHKNDFAGHDHVQLVKKGE